MPGGYWWECEKCLTTFDFQPACGSAGIAHFIQDRLKKEWDQSLLTQICPGCGTKTLRIAYEFPGKERESFRVYSIVGIDDDDGKYIPMMFETKETPKCDVSVYDFKYLKKRSTFGLNKAAIMSQDNLRKIFDLYCQKTGRKSFP